VINSQRFASIDATPAHELQFRQAKSKRHNPFVFMLLAASLIFSVMQVGCTGLTSANATDPAIATTIAVAGATGSFGSVATGSSVTQTFAIANTGTMTLTITELAATGTGYSVSGGALPISVAPGKSTSVIAKFTPAKAGAVTGNISITANTNPSVTSIALSGTGTAAGQPVIAISPGSVSYGGVSVGQDVGQLMMISNLGSGPLTVSNISVAGVGYSITGVTLPVTVDVGRNFTFIAHLNPTTTGTIQGGLTFANNSSTSSLVIPMSGFGVAAQSPAQSGIAVSPASINFGSVAVGQNVGQLVTISNSGASPLTVSNVAVSGASFSVSGVSLPITIGAGQSAAFLANINATSTGAISGGLTITNNSPNPNVVLPLSAFGVNSGQPIISANPSSVSFGNVTVGAPNSQTIVLQNNGTASLTISQATVSGAGFSMSGLATPATIAAGSSTTFNVAFGPTGAGAVSGSVSVVSNAAGSPTSIPLSGTGVTVTRLLSSSTAGLAFGNVAVSNKSSQNVILTNNGNSTVTIGSASVSGAGFGSSGVVAGQTIGAGQTATLGVSFTPASAATVSGTVTVTSNATNSPISVALSGTGTQAVAHSVSLSWTASTSTVVGYNVYRGTTSGGPYTLITSSPVNGTTFTDTTVQAGATYFYVVTAVDTNGNESVNSNEVSVTVPTP
jgi:hypothetical protein